MVNEKKRLMSKIIIPLFYRPGLKRDLLTSREISGVSLKAAPGATLLTLEAVTGFLDAIGDRGRPCFHVFETRMEARAAQALLSREEIRLRGASSETEVGTLRDGEGVLMILHRDRPVSDSRFEVIDNRLVRDRTVLGSWSLPGEEIAPALTAVPGVNRNDLATAIAAKIAVIPPNLLRAVQTALERVPGASTGFVSVSPDKIRRASRLEGVDPARLPDRLIQPILAQVSAEADIEATVREVVEATVDRILVAHPELLTEDPDVPEPGS